MLGQFETGTHTMVNLGECIACKEKKTRIYEKYEHEPSENFWKKMNVTRKKVETLLLLSITSWAFPGLLSRPPSSESCGICSDSRQQERCPSTWYSVLFYSTHSLSLWMGGTCACTSSYSYFRAILCLYHFLFYHIIYYLYMYFLSYCTVLYYFRAQRYLFVWRNRLNKKHNSYLS